MTTDSFATLSSLIDDELSLDQEKKLWKKILSQPNLQEKIQHYFFIREGLSHDLPPVFNSSVLKKIMDAVEMEDINKYETT